MHFFPLQTFRSFFVFARIRRIALQSQQQQNGTQHRDIREAGKIRNKKLSINVFGTINKQHRQFYFRVNSFCGRYMLFAMGANIPLFHTLSLSLSISTIGMSGKFFFNFISMPQYHISKALTPTSTSESL